MSVCRNEGNDDVCASTAREGYFRVTLVIQLMKFI